MSRFVLRPAKIVGSRIVPVAGAEPLTLNLKEMYARFARSGEIEAKRKIVYLRAGSYFGLLRDERQQVRNFTIIIPSRDTRVDWLLRTRPTLPAQIVELFEVESALLDAQVLNEQSADTA